MRRSIPASVAGRGVRGAGELRGVGMSSWVFGRGGGRAIAMDVAERVVASLRSEGRIKRPYLGIGTQEVPLPDAVKGRVNQESGLLIVAVEPHSPSAEG